MADELKQILVKLEKLEDRRIGRDELFEVLAGKAQHPTAGLGADAGDRLGVVNEGDHFL